MRSLAGFFVWMALFPSASDALTLAEAQRLAATHNPDLAASRLELQALQGAEMQAGARPNPELGVLVEDTRSATRTTTFQLSQAIELGNKRGARQAAAAQARAQASVALAARQADVRAAVATAYFEVLGAQSQQSLASASLALARSAAAVAEKRLQAGKAPPLEVAKAQVAESGARTEVAQAESELLLARGRLAALWGQGPQTVEPIAEDTANLPPMPDDLRVSQAMTSAPALQMARLEISRRQALTEIERARRTPDVTVTVGAKRDAELGRTQSVIGFSLPLPIHDRNQGALLEALRREDQAREVLTAATLRLQTDVAQAVSKLRLNHQQAQVLRQDALPTAQAAYDIALKGYEMGKFAFMDVLDAQRTLFQVRRQLLLACTEAHRAAAELDRLLGLTATHAALE